MTTSSYVPPSILPSPLHSLATNNASMSPMLIATNTQQEGLVSKADAPNDLSTPAKMFVGGLPQSVNQTTLRSYFERYGRINEAFILMDDASGRSRGFGFVTFENPSSLLQVLASGPHYLEGKHVDCKHAVLKNVNPTNVNSSNLVARQQGSGNVCAVDGSTPWARALKVTEAASIPTEKFEDTQQIQQGDDEEDIYLTGGGKSYLALSGDKWLEDCAEADERKIFVGGLPDVTLSKWELATGSSDR